MKLLQDLSIALHSSDLAHSSQQSSSEGHHGIFTMVLSGLTLFMVVVPDSAHHSANHGCSHNDQNSQHGHEHDEPGCLVVLEGNCGRVGEGGRGWGGGEGGG